jgi:UDP-N-acetylglucosamine--N-acetylmuramyl-(pentapeptide) pyrophosphoryl-undecaprenol N-acetylglucosamine transferase
MTVAVAAAGTGGHVRPALAIAAAMVRQGMDPGEIVFLGGERYEAEAVPRAGYPFVGFPLVKLDRTPTLRHLRIPAVLRRSAAAMAEELVRRGVRVMLGMAGYVTVPAAMAARRAGVPLYLQEQNASPGLAARFAARRARRTFLGLPGRAERLPRSELLGNPLGPEFDGFDRRSLVDEARRRYAIEEDRAVLGVVGGSLGAGVLNRAVADLAAAWTGPPVSIVHLTGTVQHEEMQHRAGGSPLPWRVVGTEERMDLFYAAADLVVCRAGAMTVSEIAATATAAVFVPLRRVGQHHNAAALTGDGAARLLPEGELQSLPAVVGGLLADDAARGVLAAAAGAHGRPGAADAIARRVLEAARG